MLNKYCITVNKNTKDRIWERWLTGSAQRCVPLLRRTPPAICPPVGWVWGRSVWRRECRGTSASPETGTAAPSDTRPEAETQNTRPWRSNSWLSCKCAMLASVYSPVLRYRCGRSCWWCPPPDPQTQTPPGWVRAGGRRSLASTADTAGHKAHQSHTSASHTSIQWPGSMAEQFHQVRFF